MATPYFTLTTFRELTRVRQAKLGIAPAGTQTDGLLQTELDRAAAYVQMVTGQPATDKDLPIIPPALDASLTAGVLQPLIGQAIQMRTEQVAFQSQNGYVDDASDDVVTSLSVGSFSQTKTRTGKNDQKLNSWDALASLLWMLMTPDRYDYWVVALGMDAAKMLAPWWNYENAVWPPYGYADIERGGWDWSYGGGLPYDILPLDLGGLA